MGQLISVFNNKGGVGKTNICWNVADTLARLGKNVLLIDFDPQCNLSIAVLGENAFVQELQSQNIPYGTTLRSYLQRFLQNTGGEQIFLHQGKETHNNVFLIAGDFWLNVYADSLNVGADLLSGTGLSKYVVLRRMVNAAEEKANIKFDFVLIDLPPSFGALVRAAFYSSDYFIVPCTSDNFSVYCVGLIGQMVPKFIVDWTTGLARFNNSNPNFDDFNSLGKPVFAGWVFNGYDTTRGRRTKDEIDEGVQRAEKKLVRADDAFRDKLEKAIAQDLISKLDQNVLGYPGVAAGIPETGRIGGIEDANVLIQNSLEKNVPLGQLKGQQQLSILQDRSGWSRNQLEQIDLLSDAFKEISENVLRICV